MWDFRPLAHGERRPNGHTSWNASPDELLSPAWLDLPAEALPGIIRFDGHLGRCRSLDDTLRMTIVDGLTSFGALGGVVALLGYDARLDHVHCSPGYEWLAARCSRLPLDAPSPLAEVIRTGKWRMVDPGSQAEAGVGATPNTRWVVMPIRGGQGVIGGLWLFLPPPTPCHEPELFAALTERLGTAIERIRLIDSERRLRLRAEQATARISRLQSLTTGLSSALEPPDVADAVMAFAVAELGANGGMFFMRSDDGLLHTVRSVGREPPAVKDIPMKDGDRSWLGRRGVVIDSSEVGSPRRTIRAFVPLTMRGQVRGAIELTFPHDLHPRAELRSFLGVLGSQCSDAMDRARLYRQRGHEARVLQTSLLPPALPTIRSVDIGAAYHPFGDGTTVGGDFYNIYQLAGDTWAFDLGDVSGKGVEAAALTAMVRYTARAAALLHCGPSEVLQVVNRVMLQEALDDRFCTMVHGAIEASKDHVHINLALGGHPRPLFLDGSTREVRPVGVPGTAIGCLSDPELTETRLLLQKGDAVVFFTDGCIDFRAGGRTNTDEGPLLEALSAAGGDGAAGLAKRVEEAVLETKGGSSSDDIAVLVVRRREDHEPAR